MLKMYYDWSSFRYCITNGKTTVSTPLKPRDFGDRQRRMSIIHNLIRTFGKPVVA